MTGKIVCACAFAACLLAAHAPALGQEPLGTAFTYQGQLRQSGAPLDATGDFEFSLWNDPNSTDPNDQVGSTVSASNVSVDKGLFTVQLDFGAEPFTGEARWLAISIRTPSGSGPYTTLTPRQPITATPYALQTRGLFVDDDLKVGVGTVFPTVKFDVYGGLRVVGAPADEILLEAGPGSGTVTLQGGAGYDGDDAAGNGGGVEIKSGAGGDALADQGGYGGDLRLKAGLGGDGAGVGGIGGSVWITAGDGGNGMGPYGNGNSGGSVHVWAGHTGDGHLADTGGDVDIQAGRGEVEGGHVTIHAGPPGGSVLIDGDPLLGAVKLGSGGSNVLVGRSTPSDPSHFSFDVGPASRIGSDLPNGGLAITQSGDVGIGTTSPGYELDVNGDIGCEQLHESSDRRMKSNIRAIADGLEKVSKLRGVHFEWKREAFPGRKLSKARQIGFVAQEVEGVLPEVVSRGADGMYSVNYGRVVAVLVEAVKELHAEIEARDARILELTSRLERVEALVAEVSKTTAGGAR